MADEGTEELDRSITPRAVKNILRDPPPALLGDITFEETPRGFEILYSEHLANKYPGLVDQSADWLENKMGVLNLGQIDHTILLADGRLTDDVRDGLIAWWAARIEDLDLGS